LPSALEEPVKFLCVCSGVSSPTSAWTALGWESLAYAEIDPYASGVLGARYGAGRPRFMPDPGEPGLALAVARKRAAHIRQLEGLQWGPKPNLGDFTRLRDEELIADADLLVGGTPCQTFSLSGRRASLSDDRGNLALEFIRLANATDDLRRARGKPPAWILWENVPGVFSPGDNPFGSFLAGLVGSERALERPGGGSWPDAGVVAGPERVAAWRVLDAQRFGLAQRRRRVFVLARGGPGGFAAADALLPIGRGVRGGPPGDSPPPAVYAGADSRGLPGGGRLELIAAAFSRRGRDGENMVEPEPGRIAPALRTGGGGSSKPFVAHAWRTEAGELLEARARLLTPLECERLQGLPDNHTLIPFSDGRRSPEDLAETVAYLERLGFGAEDARALAPTPDSHRYRVLGNSMSREVLEHIGRRIEAVS
jgi:DNA (cytosine-5)-methyltransferase 1